MDKNQFIEQVEKMSVAELNDLVKALEEKFGVSAAAMAVAGPAAGGEAGAAEVPVRRKFRLLKFSVRLPVLV